MKVSLFFIVSITKIGIHFLELSLEKVYTPHWIYLGTALDLIPWICFGVSNLGGMTFPNIRNGLEYTMNGGGTAVVRRWYGGGTVPFSPA